MHAALRALRRTTPSIFQPSPSSLSPLQKSLWLTSHHLFCSRSDSDNDENLRSRSSSSSSEEPGPSGSGGLSDWERGKRAEAQAMSLLRVALDEADENEEGSVFVREEEQKSLRVGIVGAPNAGKSKLTNYLVGSLSYSFTLLLSLFLCPALLIEGNGLSHSNLLSPASTVSGLKHCPIRCGAESGHQWFQGFD